MLKLIFEQLHWRSSDERRTAIYLDESISEAIKWHEANQAVIPDLLGTSSGNSKDNYLILDLYDLSQSAKISSLESFISHQKPERVVFWTSIINDDRVATMKRLLVASAAPECIILSSMSSNATNTLLPYADNSSYTYLAGIMEPALCTIYYFPFHSISLLPSNSLVDLRVLCSHQSRSVRPLTLCGLGIYGSSEYNSIYDVPAADLPNDTRSELKVLAHDLAGALLFDIGVDPSSSIFSIGKTSGIIGHNLLGILENLSEWKSSYDIESKIGLQLRDSLRLISGLNQEANLSPQKPGSASLVLIDRTEDLFTPGNTTGDQPLLSRVLNALKISKPTRVDAGKANRRSPQKVMLDIPLNPLWYEATILLSDDEELGDDSSQLMRPMSGVSSLLFQTHLSICYNSIEERKFSSTASPTLPSTSKLKGLVCELATGNEDKGRQALSNELKKRIMAEQGQLPPPKKRGLGAEILSMVQSLIKAPGIDYPANQLLVKDFNLRTATRSQGLVALSLTVIEAMQRSSNKQFQQICNWKASLDVRAARECEVIDAYEAYDDIDICASTATKYFLLKSDEISSISKKADAPVAGSLGDVAADGPIDLIHSLVQIVGLLSLFRFHSWSTSFLSDLTINMARYLLKAGDLELRFLRQDGVISDPLFHQIKAINERKPSRDDMDQLVEYIATKLSEAFEPLLELSAQYKQSAERFKSRLPSGMNMDALRCCLFSRTKIGGLDQMSTTTGIVSSVVEEYAQYLTTHQPEITSLLWDHVETPLQQMARQGLGLLSKGLGRLGFGGIGASKIPSDGPHPGINKTLVLFVLGGISYKEVAQVRSVMEGHPQLQDVRIIIISTSTINNEDVLPIIFNR